VRGRDVGGDVRAFDVVLSMGFGRCLAGRLGVDGRDCGSSFGGVGASVAIGPMWCAARAILLAVRVRPAGDARAVPGVRLRVGRFRSLNSIAH